MAISKKGNALLSRLKPLLTLQRFNHSLAKGGPQTHIASNSGLARGQINFSKWRRVDSRTLGITRAMIPEASWVVLKVLQSKGFEAYLVGGCVRDLLLNRIPKDYDVITTATLQKIKKQFHRSEIVGRRFPICLVHVKGSVIEVSSFETVTKHAEGKKEFNILKIPGGCDSLDLLRWRNSMCRDFTINSLFFNPFVNKIYDYANGMMDLRSSKLQTLLPAQLSFKDDCARILRGLRIAARLGLSFSKETEDAIYKLSSSIASLSKCRLMLELNYMLSYGAAEPSLRLLWRFNVLEILLPFHAAYLGKQSIESGSMMLMKLFFNLDRLVTCDRPSDSVLWVGLLAFHLALVNSPQHPLVVLAFASVLYHAKWEEGVKFARQHAQAPISFAPEIAEAHDFISDDELVESITQLALMVKDSIDVLTEEDSLLRKMARFPGYPCSGLVFISKKMGSSSSQIFNVLAHDVESYKRERNSFEINYELLRRGNVCETRFVLGKIILDTIGCGIFKGGEVIEEENGHNHTRTFDHEQKEEVSEEYICTISDLVKHHVVDKDKKQKLTRQKAIVNKEPENQKIAKQKNLVDNKKCLVAKSHKKVISNENGCKVQDHAATAEGKIVMMEASLLKKARTKKHLQVAELLEQGKGDILKVEVTKKQKEWADKLNLSGEDTINTKCNLNSEEDVINNTECHLNPSQEIKASKEKRKQQMIKGTGRRVPLSSLFK